MPDSPSVRAQRLKDIEEADALMGRLGDYQRSGRVQTSGRVALPSITNGAGASTTQGGWRVQRPDDQMEQFGYTGAFSGLSKALGGIVRPIAKATGLDSYIEEDTQGAAYRTVPSTLMGSGKELFFNALKFTDELPGYLLSKAGGEDVKRRMEALGTYSSSTQSVGLVAREADELYDADAQELQAAFDMYRAIRKTGATTVSELAARYREKNKEHRAEVTQQGSMTTVVADPFTAPAGTDQQVVYREGVSGTKADTQVNDRVAAMEYLKTVKFDTGEQINDEQANRLLDYFDMYESGMDTVDIWAVTQRDSLKDFWKGRYMDANDVFLKAGAAIYEYGQKGVNMALDNFEQLPGVVKFALAGPVGLSINGQGFVENVVRHGGAAMTGDAALLYKLKAGAVPVQLTTTALGLGAAYLDQDYLRRMEELDKKMYEQYGKKTTYAEDFIKRGAEEMAQESQEYKDSLGMHGSMGIDLLNATKVVKGAKNLLTGTKAAQSYFMKTGAVRQLTPKNFIAHMDSGKVNTTGIVFGDARRAHEAFEGLAKGPTPKMTAAEAANMEYLTEMMFRDQFRRAADTLNFTNGAELIRNVKTTLDRSNQTFLEASLDVTSKVERHVDWIKASQLAEDFEKRTGLSLGTRGLQTVTELGGTRRALTPKEAVAASKTALKDLMDEVDSALRSSGITDDLRSQLLKTKSWAEKLAGEDRAVFWRTTQDLARLGYRLGPIDALAKGRIRVTDYLTDKALYAAKLDAQTIATSAAELEGLANQYWKVRDDMAKAVDLNRTDLIQETALVELRDNLQAAAKKSFSDLHKFILDNKGETFIQDLLRESFPGYAKKVAALGGDITSLTPTLAMVRSAEGTIRKGLLQSASRINQFVRMLNSSNVKFDFTQARALLRSLEMSSDTLGRVAKFTKEGRAIADDVIARARKMELAVPESFHAYIAHPGAVKAAFEKLVDTTQRILTPFTGIEARRIAITKLSQKLRDAGLTREGIINAINKTIELQADSGLFGQRGLWKGVRGGSRRQFFDAMDNWGKEFGALTKEQRHIVEQALVGTFGHSVASLYTKWYNVVRFTNPRYLLAETIEQGAANFARHGGSPLTYYRSTAADPDNIQTWLGNFSDLRVADDLAVMGRTKVELDAIIAGEIKANPGMWKKVQTLIGIKRKEKAGVEQVLGSLRARALDNSILRVSRQQALDVYKQMPQWSQMLKKYKTEQGVMDALDDFWLNPNKADILTKKYVIEELGISVERQKIIASEIERRVRERLKASGTVASKSAVMGVLNHPFLSPFLAYNMRMTKLGLKVFAGHGFGIRYGMGLMYVYKNYDTFSSGELEYLQENYPETAKILQYLLIPANPAKVSPGVGAVAPLVEGDIRGIGNEMFMKVLINPPVNGYGGMGRAGVEIADWLLDRDPRTGRDLPRDHTSPFLQEATKGL